MGRFSFKSVWMTQLILNGCNIFMSILTYTIKIFSWIAKLRIFFRGIKIIGLPCNICHWHFLSSANTLIVLFSLPFYIFPILMKYSPWNGRARPTNRMTDLLSWHRRNMNDRQFTKSIPTHYSKGIIFCPSQNVNHLEYSVVVCHVVDIN